MTLFLNSNLTLKKIPTTPMSTLHLIRTSPFDNQDLKLCLATLSVGDQVVFIDDGCYALQHKLMASIEKYQVNCFAIEQHLNARALSKINNIAMINMHDLVQLTLNNQRVITWQ